jgi:hypothetical protein
MSRAHLAESTPGQAEPGRYADDRFGPDLVIQALTRERNSLSQHTQIVDRRQEGHCRSQERAAREVRFIARLTGSGELK